MVVGASLKAHTEYVSVSIQQPIFKHEQLESGYSSSASTSFSENLPKLKRPTTGQPNKHAEKKSAFPVNYKHSAAEHYNLQQHQSKQPRYSSQKNNNDPIAKYNRIKTANSLISLDMMISKEFKSNPPSISIDRSRRLPTPSKYQQETANYSDDWESDYSDDFVSDGEDTGKTSPNEETKSTNIYTQQKYTNDIKTTLEEAIKSTSIPTQQVPRNDIQTNKKEVTTSPNASTQKECLDDLKADIKESQISTSVQMKLQPKINSLDDSISLVPLDLSAFEPVFCQQRQAAIDNMTYRTAVNSWNAKSLPDVVKLIIQLSFGKSLIERAWIVFYWISQNIEYDIDAYFSGNIRHQSTNDIFENRKGVCDAFGTIFEALCKGVGLECKKISGCAKGHGFSIERAAFDRTNHAWNAVRLDGHWYLVDPTWGEGHIDTKNQNVKKLSPFYFLVRPEQMIYRHFPEDPQWQLLKTPISMKDFVRLPNVYSEYFELGIQLVYPCQSNMASLKSNQEVAEVLLRAPDNVDFMTSIKHTGYNENKDSSLVQYDADRQWWQCLFAPRKSGFHTLTIFARRIKQMVTENIEEGNSYSCVAELGLLVPADFQGTKTFPTTYGLFGQHKCQIMQPFDGSLKAGSKATIQCRIPDAYCARLLLDGNWLREFIIKNDIFQTEFTVPKREIMVYVKFQNKKNSSSYDGLIKYSVH